MICFGAHEVKNVWESFKGREVDSLDKQVRFSTRLCGSYQHHFFNVFVAADQDGFECSISQSQNKELLKFKRELKRYCGRFIFDKLQVTLDER